MGFAVLRSFFLLTVAISGLGLIVSAYDDSGRGFILGEEIDSRESLDMFRAIPIPEREVEEADDARTYLDTLRSAPAPTEGRSDDFVQRQTPGEEQPILRDGIMQQKPTQEIVIPRRVVDENSSRMKKESTLSARIAAEKESQARPIPEIKTRRDGSVRPAPMIINDPKDVRISAEVETDDSSRIKETGFYSRGPLGQESYLGRGVEVSEGKFEYRSDLSRQLSSGDQEILFRSRMETIGAAGERIISEETKSIPVSVVTRNEDARGEMIRDTRKEELLNDLRRTGTDPSRISEIESVTSDQIAFVREAEHRDFDQDGITNFEEKNRGTDPFLADSDNDGFLDGDEVRGGYDPTKFSSGDGADKVVFENPKDVIAKEKKDPGKKKTVDTRYKVDAVAVVPVGDSNSDKKAIRFSGKALPNIFITLYVYSTPVIVTVKTDADGNWSYDLDKDVEDGDHEAYVAVTDNTGKITARSEGIGFIKTADAITVQPIAEAAEAATENQSPLERSQVEYFFVAFIAILFFSGAALIVVSRKSAVGSGN